MTTTLLAKLCSASPASVSSTSRGSSSTSRICFIKPFTLFLGGERKRKRRAAIHGPLSPGSAAVTKNDSLYVGQSDACAVELVAAVQALKYAEELVGVL